MWFLSLFHISKYSEAIEYSQKMYELYPDNPNAVANMVKANTQSGKLMEAEKICIEYLKENVNDDKYLDELSKRYSVNIKKADGPTLGDINPYINNRVISYFRIRRINKITWIVFF